MRQILNSLWRYKLIICFVFFCSLLAFVYYQNLINDRSSILTKCEGVHLKTNVHYHATIEIRQDGELILIPANIGIVGKCIHPLHTHDNTGLIHMDYSKKVAFTLSDFFDMQGIIMTDNQIGSIKTTDKYTIEIKVNNKIINTNYRNIVLHDKDRILISIAYLGKNSN